MNKVLVSLCATALLLGNTSGVFAQSVVGSDFNSDGYSDIALIQIQGDSTLDWTAFTRSGSAVPEVSTKLGVAGNHIALANWASKKQAQLGLISLGIDKALWTVVSSTGAALSREFGNAKDSLISGGDFNGDGIADAAYIKKPLEGETVYQWRIRYSFFKDLAGGGIAKIKDKKVNFGTVGDAFFFVNVEGKNDWIAVLGPNPAGSGSEIRLKNPVDGKSKKFTVASFDYDGVRPLRLRQKNKRADLLALVTREGGSTPIKFVDMRGRSKGTTTLPGEGELIVGNFGAGRGAEIAIQNSDGSFLVHNPVTAEQAAVSVPTGVAIDDININSFDSNPTEPTCEDETLSPNDGTDLFLWKPKGENSGLLRVLFPQIWTGKITEVVLINPEQQIIETASLSYDASNPNARTFASFRKPGGRYPLNVIVRARLVAGCYKSYVIPTPADRHD